MEKAYRAKGNLDAKNLPTDKRASPSISQLNAKHQQIINQHLPIGIIESSLDGKYLDANEEFCLLLGYEKEELLQRGIQDVTQEDYEVEIKLHSQLVAGEIPYYKLEKRYERKDGQVIWVELTRSAIRDASGNILYTVGIVLDITERHLAEDALRESERKFSLIFDKLPFAATLTKPQDGLILDVNETFEKIFGYSKHEVIGKTMLELELIPDAETRERILAELLERNSVRGIELELLTKANGRRVFLANMDLVEIEGETYILQTDQDITERKQVLEALHESEERFRAILSQATAGIVRKGPDGTLLFVNDAFCRMVGYTFEELVSEGKTCWDLTHPDDIVENKRLFDQMITEGIPFQMERRLIRRDGSILWANVSVSPVLGVAGYPVSAVGVEVDITSRKQAEASLRQLNLELESRVEERTAELKAMNEALQKSRRRLQVLSQRLVQVQEDERRALARELHDSVGQSLVALNLNLTIIQGEISKGYTEKLGTRLSDSIQLVREVIVLVRDVMSNLRPTNLDDYGLESALQTYVNEFQTRYGIPVQFEKRTPALPRLNNNIEITLLRIGQEALSNIGRHAQASRAILSLRLDEKQVYLTIEDDGIGIPAQEGAKRSRSHGLKIMQERAEALEGTIHIRSAPGKGTKIEVHIPLISRETDTSSQEQSS
jgi:PAS domain S-box-containing protein